jgi:FAD/FMN-containing dehydrogenase
VPATVYAEGALAGESPDDTAATWELFPGLSTNDGGIIIDLSLMKGIRVDPEAQTARAQAGVLLGELDRETQEFGLAVPPGS